MVRKFRIVKLWNKYKLQEYVITGFTSLWSANPDTPIYEWVSDPKAFKTPELAEQFAHYVVNGRKIVKEFEIGKVDTTNTTTD